MAVTDSEYEACSHSKKELANFRELLKMFSLTKVETRHNFKENSFLHDPILFSVNVPMPRETMAYANSSVNLVSVNWETSVSILPSSMHCAYLTC